MIEACRTFTGFSQPSPPPPHTHINNPFCEYFRRYARRPFGMRSETPTSELSVSQFHHIGL
ncbi:MAG: hypothetical protein ACK54Y_10950 [Bacteroidota bacterium]